MSKKIQDELKGAFSKATEFVGHKAGEVAEYLGLQKQIFEKKAELKAEKDKLETLFSELGRISYYRGSTVKDRDRKVVADEIKVSLKYVSELEAELDELLNDKESSDDDIEDDIFDENITCPDCEKVCSKEDAFCSACGHKFKKDK